MRYKPKIIVNMPTELREFIDPVAGSEVGHQNLKSAISAYVPIDGAVGVVFDSGRVGCMFAALSHIRTIKSGYESLTVATVSDVRLLPNSYISRVSRKMPRFIADEVFEQQFRGNSIQIPAQYALKRAQSFYQMALRYLPSFLELCVASEDEVERRFRQFAAIAALYGLNLKSELEANRLVIHGVKLAACQRAAS